MVVLCTFWILIVAYSLKARTVKSQQLAGTRQQPINNNRGMVFSAQSVLMAGHAVMEYIMPSPSSNCTATEEFYFLHGLYQVVISRTT
jgi:hypothetical protein